MEKTDRAGFVTGVFADKAYEDMPLPIACGQTISQPSVVGLMTQALQIQPRDKVLEIGTGSGYQAAILARLARRVYTIDRYRRLMQEARARFEALDLTNITAVNADGCFGLPEQAPFDRILVTAAGRGPARPALGALRIGGIMVLPVGQSDAVQSLIRVTKGEHGYDYEDCDRPLCPLDRGAGPGNVTRHTSGQDPQRGPPAPDEGKDEQFWQNLEDPVGRRGPCGPWRLLGTLRYRPAQPGQRV